MDQPICFNLNLLDFKIRDERNVLKFAVLLKNFSISNNILQLKLQNMLAQSQAANLNLF